MVTTVYHGTIQLSVSRTTELPAPLLRNMPIYNQYSTFRHSWKLEISHLGWPCDL